MPQQGLLTGSIVMLVFGAALLWGGLTFFITTALRSENKKEHQHG